MKKYKISFKNSHAEDIEADGFAKSAMSDSFEFYKHVVTGNIEYEEMIALYAASEVFSIKLILST